MWGFPWCLPCYFEACMRFSALQASASALFSGQDSPFPFSPEEAASSEADSCGWILSWDLHLEVWPSLALCSLLSEGPSGRPRGKSLKFTLFLPTRQVCLWAEKKASWPWELPPTAQPFQGPFKTPKFALFRLSSTGGNRIPESLPRTMLGGSLCICSCLLLAWAKWNKQNKEPIREHSWDWVGEVSIYGGRSKGKYLPPGQGFIYSAGGSQITPKGSNAFGEPWRIPCPRVGALALWTEPQRWFLKKVQDALICQRTNSMRRHNLHLQGPYELAGKKRHNLYKVFKDISHAWPNLRGPGEWVIPTAPGV